MSEDRNTVLKLPKPADIGRWKEELDRIATDEAEMKARHAAEIKAIRDRRVRLQRLVQAASAFVDVTTSDDSLEPPEEQKETVAEVAPKATKKQRVRRRRGKTWTDTIMKILVAEGRGLTYSELKDKVRETHLGDTLAKTDKAFYGGIGRLAEANDLIKHNRRLYTPRAYEQFMADVAAGRAVDEPAAMGPSGESPNKIAVVRFLKTKANGATTAEIVRHILTDPPSDLAVTKNRNSIYNLLARMRKDEELYRRGDRYYLPHPKDEAPDPEGSSASTNHHGTGRGGPVASGGNGSTQLFATLPGASPAEPGQ